MRSLGGAPLGQVRRELMDNVAKIQELLDSDAGFRKQFVADPVATLLSKGFRLAKDERDALRQFCRQVKRPPKSRGHYNRLHANAGAGRDS
jgi:hypothetical protein